MQGMKADGFLRRKWPILTGTLLAGAAVALWIVDQIGRAQTVIGAVQAIPTIVRSWWFNPLLYVLGVCLIVWSVRSNRRKREIAFSAIRPLEPDECPVTRTYSGGFARGASDDKAIIIWFENASRFDYSNVRAWLEFSAFGSGEDESEEYEGLWLGENPRGVEFKAGEKKALVIAVKQGSDFYAVMNTREGHDWGGVPKLIKLASRGYHIPTILNIDGAPSKVLKCQLTLEPKLDFRFF